MLEIKRVNELSLDSKLLFVVPTNKVLLALLMCPYRDPDKGLSPREVSTVANIPYSNAIELLRKLTKIGLVETKSAFGSGKPLKKRWTLTEKGRFVSLNNKEVIDVLSSIHSFDVVREDLKFVKNRIKTPGSLRGTFYDVLDV